LWRAQSCGYVNNKKEGAKRLIFAVFSGGKVFLKNSDHASLVACFPEGVGCQS